MTNKAKKFRELLNSGTVVLPGVFNAISAKLVEQAGFDAMYLTGAGLANAVFGVPDIGIPTLQESAEHARRCNAAVQIPALADIDTGFDDLAATIQAFEAAGIAGVHLEDQVDQKKCGHLEGKQLVSADEMCERVSNASKAKKNQDFLVMARSDAKAVEGLDAMLNRCKAYVAAGADAIFVEALQTEEEFKLARKALSVPLLANMTEFGKTPYYTVKQFENWGYNMVLFPMTLFRSANFAMREALHELKQHGTQQNILDKMQTRKELYELLDYQP